MIILILINLKKPKGYANIVSGVKRKGERKGFYCFDYNVQFCKMTEQLCYLSFVLHTEKGERDVGRGNEWEVRCNDVWLEQKKH